MTETTTPRGKRALPVAPDSAPAKPGKRALPAPAPEVHTPEVLTPEPVTQAMTRSVRDLPVAPLEAIDLTGLPAHVKGSLMDDLLRTALAANAGGRRQQAVLAKLDRAEQARELLRTEQAQRAQRPGLRAFVLPGGAMMPSLDLADVGAHDVIPEGLYLRLKQASKLVELPEPGPDMTYAKAAGLHMEIAMLAGVLGKTQPKVQPKVQTSVQTAATEEVKGDPADPMCKTPDAFEGEHTWVSARRAADAEQAGKPKKVKRQAQVLVDLKPKKRAKAQALMDVLGVDEATAVAHVLTKL